MKQFSVYEFSGAKGLERRWTPHIFSRCFPRKIICVLMASLEFAAHDFLMGTL